MSERPATHEQSTHARRSSAGVAPPVRRLVTESIPSRDRSIAAVLCTVAGEVGSLSGDTGQQVERTVDSVVNAAAFFEGYIRIRRDLLETERFDRPSDRTAALLASDYLHASAYATVADAPTSDRRRLELYRALTDGSTGLATGFLLRTGDGSDGDERLAPRAVLAGTAGTLGATAVGATDETRSVLERYGRSLLAALAAHPSGADGPQAAVTEVLSDRFADGSAGDREREAVRRLPSSVRSHLERARTALAALDGVDDAASPMRRLERATRIPFEDVATDDA